MSGFPFLGDLHLIQLGKDMGCYVRVSFFGEYVHLIQLGRDVCCCVRVSLLGGKYIISS